MKRIQITCLKCGYKRWSKGNDVVRVSPTIGGFVVVRKLNNKEITERPIIGLVCPECMETNRHGDYEVEILNELDWAILVMEHNHDWD